MLTKIMVKRYLTQLAGKEGCNFRYKKKGHPETATWKCWGDFRLTKKILTKLGATGAEIGKVLGVARRHGGFCDCEILFNAKAGLLKKSWR